ncbi:MAG: hypothetical protein HDQ88_06335 [Clostridia bacterium]|nr:hypothetical protein [Clostridia bacterium]
MAKKLKILIIALLGAIATICVCVVAGCKINYSVDEYREKFNVPAQVTYFLNGVGGTFKGNNKYVQDLYVSDGSTAFDIGTGVLLSGSTGMEGQQGYNFTGWYECETDSSGTPLYKDGTSYSKADGFKTDKGGMMRKATPYDFNTKLKNGDHIYLCGDWYEDARVHFKLISVNEAVDGYKYPITKESITYTKNNEKQTVKIGEELIGYSQIIDRGVGLDKPSSSSLSIPGYTFVGFYEDEAGTKEFDGWKINYPDNPSAENNDIWLYAKYMEGEWTFVNNVTQVRTMFSATGSSGNYYLMQDIDCSTTTTIKNASKFTGHIQGNGYTISNINITQDRVGNSKVSLFGDIGSIAIIENVTFENVNLNVTVVSNATADVYFLANSVDANATISNVTVQGTLNIIKNTNSSKVSLTATKWLYGDVENSERSSIKVNATCTIDNELLDTFNNTNINSEEL